MINLYRERLRNLEVAEKSGADVSADRAEAMAKLREESLLRHRPWYQGALADFKTKLVALIAAAHALRDVQAGADKDALPEFPEGLSLTPEGRSKIEDIDLTALRELIETARSNGYDIG